jgi:rare lipoprotein A
MIWRLAALAGIGLFGAVEAAAQELPRFREHPPERQRYSAVGLASWYGNEFHRHATADGEIFDMGSLSAAHRTMPLPSYARVTNLGNGRSIVVRVNDRGPFVGGRILDVSARVARLLAFDHLGVAKVRLDYVGKAPPAGSDEPALLASLQTGAARVAAAAARLAPGGGTTEIARTAPAPPEAHPALDEGETEIARTAVLLRAADELVAYPFTAQAARP